jgi:hypothetical protein
LGVFWDYFLYKCDFISSLTEGEVIAIIITYNVIGSKAFDCGSCLSQFENRAMKEEIRAKQYDKVKLRNHCKEPSRELISMFNLHFSGINIQFKKCVGNFYSKWAAELIRFQDHFDKGIMFYNGSYGEQPAKFVEAMNIIEALKNDRLSKEKDK